MTATYTRDGSGAFNQRLHDVLTRIADRVETDMGNNLVSLILGGGYGRGEGGVVVLNGVEMPYNDLDFTLVVQNKTKVPWERLNAVRSAFAAELKIHVDFSRPLTIRDIENWPCWLMWYDLLNGHVTLKGPSDLLQKHAPDELKKPLPAIEGTRLLLNRGAGVLWALRVVRNLEDEPDEDFVRRNYYKCALALGDALLITYGRYTTKYSGRDALVRTLAGDEPKVALLDLTALYEEALKFKFRPDSVTSQPKNEKMLSELAQKWGEVFLLVENIRTGLDLGSLDEYVDWTGIREKDQHTLKPLCRNIIRNLSLGKLTLRYPRENLYRQLPVLLGLGKRNSQDWPVESQEFLKVWDRFN